MKKYYLTATLLLSLIAFRVATAQQPPRHRQSLPQAHAHNDYEHQRPLLDALEHRFCSVEADIWLVGKSSLLVGHDMLQLRPERTLAALYLEPLLNRCRANQGWVYEPGRTIILLIDLKSNGERTYPVLAAELRKFRELLISKSNEPPAVLAILSGSRPTALVVADNDRLCGIDGRLGDLPSEASSNLVPLVSDNFRNYFRWRGQGPMPAEEQSKLRNFVESVHAEGRKLRFWGTPDIPRVWTELRNAGVDLIGTDDLGQLAKFLTAQPDLIPPP